MPDDYEPPNSDDVEEWIRRINNEGIDLSDYETDFMYTVTDAWERSRKLTPRQLTVLERIFSEKVR